MITLLDETHLDALCDHLRRHGGEIRARVPDQFRVDGVRIGDVAMVLKL